MAVGGKLTYLAHGTHASPNSNTDYQDDTRDLSISLDQKTIDATVFGDAYEDFETSFKSATGEVKYKYSTAMWNVINSIYDNGDTITFEVGFDGTTTGKPKITGSWFITKIGFPVSVGNLMEFTVSYQITGAVSFGSYA